MVPSAQSQGGDVPLPIPSLQPTLSLWLAIDYLLKTPWKSYPGLANVAYPEFLSSYFEPKFFLRSPSDLSSL